MTRWPPRPTLALSFYKGHGLGNDYLVFEEGDAWPATPENVRRVCHPHRGVGSDGIVVLSGRPVTDDVSAPPDGGGEARPPAGDREAGGSAGGDEAAGRHVRLRMFNPDGGEFERSGNGLRVLASHLLRKDDALREIVAEVGGSRVRMEAHGREGPRYDVSVEMGRARIGPEAVEMAPGTLDDEGRFPGPDGAPLEVVPVSVGNPHVVVLCRDESELTEERLASVGPYVAEHPDIRHGTNVQLALHDGDRRARALIWERGVGRTSASGTSSCAVAVALVSSGLVEPGPVHVGMPGGELVVTVSDGLDVILRGPVEEIAEGRLSARLVQEMRGGSGRS